MVIKLSQSMCILKSSFAKRWMKLQGNHILGEMIRLQSCTTAFESRYHLHQNSDSFRNHLLSTFLKRTLSWTISWLLALCENTNIEICISNWKSSSVILNQQLCLNNWWVLYIFDIYGISNFQLLGLQQTPI